MATLANQMFGELEKLSKSGQTKDDMSEEHIELIESISVKFIKQAEHTEEANINSVKESFAQFTNTFKNAPRMIPAMPLLEDFDKALSSDATIDEAEKSIELFYQEKKQLFQEKIQERIRKLEEFTYPITFVMEAYQNKNLSAEEASQKMISLVEDAILVPDSNNEVNENAKERILERLEKCFLESIKDTSEDLEYKTEIILNECRCIIEEGVHDSLMDSIEDINRQKEYLNNRRGKVGENLVAKKLYDLLDQDKIPGIVSTGLITNSDLKESLSKFGINITPAEGPKAEGEGGIMMLTQGNHSVDVTFIQVKVPELNPWMNTERRREDTLAKNTIAAVHQLQEDIKMCFEILPDISSRDFSDHIRIKFYVAFPEESVEDWKHEDEFKHYILFKEDLTSLDNLGKKIKLEPPLEHSEDLHDPPLEHSEDLHDQPLEHSEDQHDPSLEHSEDLHEPSSEHSEDLHDIFLKIGSRYFGMPNYVEVEIAVEEEYEGYEVQERQLDPELEATRFSVRSTDSRVSVKSIELKERQTDIFRSGIGLRSGYVAVGPYGGGKTTLLKLEGKRIAERAQQNGTPTLLIFCVWQIGAEILIKEYENFIKTLPSCDNLEVQMTTKMTLLDARGIKSDGGKTTLEINELCKDIDSTDKRDVYLLIDLVWVLWEVPRNYRNVPDPNIVIGNIPFVKHNVIYPWSNLDPGNVHLIVSAMSDSETLVDKHLISGDPPEQGKVVTYILPQTFTFTNKVHHFLMYIEGIVEAYVREHGGWRYIIHPDTEEDGHDIMGEEPEWIDVKKAKHILCNPIPCHDCLISTVEPLLRKNMKELEAYQFLPSDVAIIVLGTKDMEKEISEKFQLINRIEKEEKEFPGTEEEIRGTEMGIMGPEIEISGTIKDVTEAEMEFTVTGLELTETENDILEAQNEITKKVREIRISEKDIKITERERTRAYLQSKFPNVVIKMEDEIEGTEMPVVFSVSNGGPSKFPEMIPFSLSRASTRLYLYCEDDKDFLARAVELGLLNKREDLTQGAKPKSTDTSMESSLEESQRAKKKMSQFGQPSMWEKIKDVVSSPSRLSSLFSPRQKDDRTTLEREQDEAKRILKR